MPGTRVLRFGVLGCATIAQRTTLPALVAEPLVRLVAVASRDGDKAAAVAARFDCLPVTGYQQLLARDDVDAVYVPLPPALHAEWAGRALAAGKHVLVEKPAVTTAGQAADLVAAARAGDRLLMENFGFLHHSQHAAVRQLIEQGAIGEPRAVVAEFAFPPLPGTDIRYRADLGGGALLDAGVYPVRASTLYLQDEVRVIGAVLRPDPIRGVDLSGAALVSAPDGRTGQLTFGFDRSYQCFLTVRGSEGTLTLDRAFSAPPTLRPVLRLQRQDQLEERTLPADHQFARLVASFAAIALDRSGAGVAARNAAGAELLQQAVLVAAVRAAALPG